MWVRKTVFIPAAADPKAVTPLLNAAAARRTTPGPKSTRYGVPLTTMAVAGPERAGSGRGVPVPSMTICDVGVGSGDDGWILRTRQSSRILEVLITPCHRSAADVSR